MTQNPDLVLLGCDVAWLNGLDVCRQLRRRGFERPIIMLTAKGEEIDRVVGLEIGQTTTLRSLLDCAKLLALIRVQLRRPSAASRVPFKYAFGESKSISSNSCNS